MRALIALTVTLLLALSFAAQSADVVRSDNDCAQLLERWASDLKPPPISH